MEGRKNELRVGIAVLISIVIVIGGIMWAKGFTLRATRYRITVYFENIGGLEAGSNVLVNGVVQGRVSEIELINGKVVVHASVDEDVIIYSDYRIFVESPNVMAGKVLSISPGNLPPAADIKLPFNGETPIGVAEAVAIFQDVTSDVQRAVRNMDTLVVSLKTITTDSANRAHLAGLLASSHDLAATSNRWLKSNGDDLSLTIQKAGATLDAAEKAINSLDSRLATTFASLDTSAAQINRLSTVLHELLAQVESGEGTVGKLFYDDSFYQRLLKTMQDVDSLAQTIQERGVKMRHRIVLF